MGANKIERFTGFRNRDFEGENFRRLNPHYTQLQNTVDQIGEIVYGQTDAAIAVARAVARVQAGYTLSNKPEFIGMFLGVPGCGKTEMGKAIANLYYGHDWEEHFLRIDSGDYHSEHSISRLTGSPTGYVGWGSPDSLVISPSFLAERNVIVFDEIEKGHVKLLQWLLPVLEGAKVNVQIGKAQYEEVKNETLDFSKSTIIFTSNVGSNIIQKERSGRGNVGFVHKKTEGDVHQAVMKELKDHYAHIPEFLDRIPQSNRIIFEQLTPEVYRRLIGKFISRYEVTRGMTLTEEVKDWLIEDIDPSFGARQLETKVDELVITPAALISLGEIPRGIPLIVGLDAEDGQKRPWFRIYEPFITAQQQKGLELESDSSHSVGLLLPPFN